MVAQQAQDPLDQLVAEAAVQGLLALRGAMDRWGIPVQQDLQALVDPQVGKLLLERPDLLDQLAQRGIQVSLEPPVGQGDLVLREIPAPQAL